MGRMKAMRVPGIDEPHRADCIRCGRVHEWYGLRRDGGQDTPKGFVCLRCLREQREAVGQ
jgi:hypothetical protein